MKYKVLTSTYPEEFETKLNKLALDGWCIEQLVHMGGDRVMAVLYLYEPGVVALEADSD